jgi:hypothetical protein
MKIKKSCGVNHHPLALFGETKYVADIQIWNVTLENCNMSNKVGFPC